MCPVQSVTYVSGRSHVSGRSYGTLGQVICFVAGSPKLPDCGPSRRWPDQSTQAVATVLFCRLTAGIVLGDFTLPVSARTTHCVHPMLILTEQHFPATLAANEIPTKDQGKAAVTIGESGTPE